MAANDWKYDVTEEPPEDEESQHSGYEILNYPADTTLQGYLDQWDNEQLRLPVFQRGYVWDQVKASKLIESFLLGLPVPGVFLYKEKDNPSFLIVDGQQRIKSIVDFMKGVTRERKFRLKKVSEQWEGKTFDELSEEDTFKLQTAIMRATIIQQLNPNDDSSIYLVFERLNTGGINLNPMEIRQCVSYGEFVSVLKKLNKNVNWRKILGKKSADIRLRDVELILRSIALSHFGKKYEKPMKGFLNDFMEFQKRNPSDYIALEQSFVAATSQIVEELGERPFHIRGRLNYSALDAFLSRLLVTQDIVGLKDKFKALLADQDFMQNITINTSDTTVVKNRIKKASEILKDGRKG